MWRRIWRFLFLVTFALSFVPACDDDVVDGDGDADSDGDSDGDGDGDPQCAWAPTGAAADLSIILRGDETELEARSTVAMNTMGLEDAGAPGPHRLGGARWGGCGSGGLAFVRQDEEPTGTVYLDLATGELELVTSSDRGDGPSLFFDADCSPVVLTVESGGYVEHLRDGGVWTATTVLDPEVDLASEGINSITAVAADVGGDGQWHLIAHGRGDDGRRLVHGARSPSAGGSWSFEVLDLPPATEVDDSAVDSAGAIHVVYRNTEYPCDPCDISLYHARSEPGGGWVQSTVQQGQWGDPDDHLAVDASLAIDADDRPFVAAQFQTRVVTGSLTSTALRVYGLVDGAFCAEDVALRSDGYAGSDGESFTGAAPAIEVDGSGRLHVAFMDLAAWHTDEGANAVPGQLRYAVRAGDLWQVATVVRQAGQTESPNPLRGAGAPNLALTAEGSSALLAAFEWEWATGSIYNMTDEPLEVRGVARIVELAPSE